jgi:CheY-like chemotaxis protein
VLVFYNIAVTANANETEKNKCMKVGMAEFIPKPFKLVDFVRLISRT